MTEEKTGIDLMDEIARHNFLDEMMRRDPADLRPIDRQRIIEAQRLERAQFIKKDTEPAEKEDDGD